MLQRHLLSSAGLAIFLFNGFTQFSPSRSHTNCQFSEAVGGVTDTSAVLAWPWQCAVKGW